MKTLAILGLITASVWCACIHAETPMPAPKTNTDARTPIAAVLFKLCDGSKFAAIVLPDGAIDVQPYSPELSAALQKVIPREHARLVDACGDPAYKGGTPVPAPGERPEGAIVPEPKPGNKPTSCQVTVNSSQRSHLEGNDDNFCAEI